MIISKLKWIIKSFKIVYIRLVNWNLYKIIYYIKSISSIYKTYTINNISLSFKSRFQSSNNNNQLEKLKSGYIIFYNSFIKACIWAILKDIN